MKKHKQDLSEFSPYTTPFCPEAMEQIVDIGRVSDHLTDIININ